MSTVPRITKSNILDVRPLPTTTDPNRDKDEDLDGPSWGLIIPIIMIAAFLIGVGFCLWWNKWRDKRTLHLHTGHSSFQRSYRGSRSARNNLDAIRDSTRSTLPLRNSMNEKINIKTTTNNIANMSKISRVNVIPLNRPSKFTYHWDVNHFRGYPQHRNPVGRPGTKPLSPIDEIDSPSSMKLSEISRNYEIGNQASFSPYHIAWVTSSNSHAESMHADNIYKNTPQFRRSCDEYLTGKMKAQLDQNQNSPFYPNNNTPTTECETESEESLHGRRTIHSGSQFTSYPSSPNSHTIHSRSTDDRHMTSYGTSFPESSFQTSSQQSGDKNSSWFQSGQTSVTDQASTYFSSLPSSIAHFSNQNVLQDDPNNNSIVVPNAYLTYPLTKIVSYTNHSSLESSETHISDNTSMLPNVGSGNTSTYPSNAYLKSQPISNEPSGHVSPEDLSKLVDEMSSIRPVDESSVRPNSTFDPTPHVISVAGHSLTAGTQESLVHHEEFESSNPNSMATSSQPTSQNGSLYWDNYPLHEKPAMSRSFPDLPLHVHDNPGFNPYATSPYHGLSYQVPTLMDKQYWV